MRESRRHRYSAGLGKCSTENAGIHAYTGIPIATNVQIWIIALITLVATVSVVSGIERGILLLGGFNVILAGILLLFVFIAGPTVFQLKPLTSTLGNYL